MTDAERREAARQFINKWNGRGKEDEDDRSYWFDILQNIMGVPNVTDYIEFQKKVVVDGNTKRIDAYIPETKVLIEQKTLGIPLDKKGVQSGGIALTPYEQAKRYNDNLPYDEKARWIVTSNFGEIWIYDMNARVPEPVKLDLMDFSRKHKMLDFLVKQETEQINPEMEVSIKAGEIVGLLYNAFLNQYDTPEDSETLKSLNKLCVRIVFCLYAEDAGIFGVNNLFHDYMAQFSAKESRKALQELFRVLNQKPEERDKYLKDDDPVLAQFPYVNGGLFADEEVDIPPFTEEIRNLVLNKASMNFDWSDISPTIFGAVFESTLNPETRRAGGMHYTSIENIHKVIDPLFLDELKAEFNEIKTISVAKTRIDRLQKYQDRLASLRWLDPAAGSGNFLTETYLCIRRLENETIRLLLDARKGKIGVEGQILFGFEEINPIKVSVDQFYGIEINDFAVTVAKTALWIAESQMMKETEDMIHVNLDFLPLKSQPHIVEGNALRMDWNDVIPANELDFIMGNPPFVGYFMQTETQKQELKDLYSDAKGVTYPNAGKIDYVAGWYIKSAEMMQSNNSIQAGLVSTNSISQGTMASAVWQPLFEQYKITIDFAWRTFVWNSESKDKAAVHCVIIGFSKNQNHEKYIFQHDDKSSVKGINQYLIEAAPIFILPRTKPLNIGISVMSSGGKPVEGGNLIFTNEEKELFVMQEPASEKWFKHFMGSEDFIHNNTRWCLWLLNCPPNELKSMPKVMQRVELVRNFRLNSKKVATRKAAEYPTRFVEIKNTSERFIVVPEISSERRRYIPIGYLDDNTILSNGLRYIPNASLFDFGIINSNVHMAWVKTVCGRLKSDYDYSVNIVYNNFPWPSPTGDQKAAIERSAQGILDARALYPDSSLADLYDELTMPPELRKAHLENDKAVMRAYGFNIKEMSEADCVAELMRMYQELVEKENHK